MTIHIKFFGLLADITGHSSLEMPVVKDTDALREKIQHEFPALRSQSFKIAVHTTLTDRNTSLKTGDVVALLPPFAGG